MKTENTDLLFLGLTRPTMFLGVTQSFFVINGLLNTILFLASNSFLPLIVLLPLLHGLGYIACLKDPRTFDLWFAYAKHCTKCKNKRFWNGANSYDVF